MSNTFDFAYEVREPTKEELEEFSVLMGQVERGSDFTIDQINQHRNTITYFTETNKSLVPNRNKQIRLLEEVSEKSQLTLKDANVILSSLRTELDRIRGSEREGLGRIAGIMKSMTSNPGEFVQEIFYKSQATSDAVQIVEVVFNALFSLDSMAKQFNKMLIERLQISGEYQKSEYAEVAQTVQSAREIAQGYGVMKDSFEASLKSFTDRGEKLEKLFDGLGDKDSSNGVLRPLLEASVLLQVPFEELAGYHADISLNLGTLPQVLSSSMRDLYSFLQDLPVNVTETSKILLEQAKSLSTHSYSMKSLLKILQRSIKGVQDGRAGLALFQSLVKVSPSPEVAISLINKYLLGLVTNDLGIRDRILKDLKKSIRERKIELLVKGVLVKNGKEQDVDDYLLYVLQRMQGILKDKDSNTQLSNTEIDLLTSYLNETMEGKESFTDMLADYVQEGNLMFQKAKAEDNKLDLSFLNYSIGGELTQNTAPLSIENSEDKETLIAEEAIKTLGNLSVSYTQFLAEKLDLMFLSTSFSSFGIAITGAQDFFVDLYKNFSNLMRLGMGAVLEKVAPIPHEFKNPLIKKPSSSRGSRKGKSTGSPEGKEGKKENNLGNEGSLETPMRVSKEPISSTPIKGSNLRRVADSRESSSESLLNRFEEVLNRKREAQVFYQPKSTAPFTGEDWVEERLIEDEYRVHYK